MRWTNLTESGRPTGLIDSRTVRTRMFDTPEFQGVTFYEVHAKSILNRVPDGSRMPFRWTVNPYRGCSHACTYCFARASHRYLDLDTGPDFDSQIVVKTNAPELLRRRLTTKRWNGDHIALGANVDCYQRAEGRYRLMPGILSALRDHANPFSVITKGTLVLRDVELLKQASRAAPVHVAVSVGFTDPGLWHAVEPGTPPPHARLRVIRTLTEAGIEVGVLMMPIVPLLGDSPAQLRETVRAVADSGASWLTPAVLYLPSGAREWFMRGLGRSHPSHVRDYDRLYAGGSNVPRWYRERIDRQVTELADEYGVAVRAEGDPWGDTSGAGGRQRPGGPVQLTLL
ncbi:Rv2578c family radical SAM protein [Streptomyces mutabilis]|uniref:Rv2578c family radical SAM protein n=1 Tax=Streptomyces mutabilis TaxID=67332 RepID=UPI0006947DC5|nr:Rv2578c family radical SAM protein [Streptomyces mutabilis]